MRLRPVHFLAVGAGVVLLMVLFPPYFGVYDQSGANLHTSVGWHPIWSPPSQAEVYATIHGEPHDTAPSDSLGGVTRLVEERLALTQVRFNKIMFLIEVMVLAMATSAASVVAARWRCLQNESQSE